MIEYSRHAREKKNGQRGITTAEQVALCLTDPDLIEPDGKPDRIRENGRGLQFSTGTRASGSIGPMPSSPAERSGRTIR